MVDAELNIELPEMLEQAKGDSPWRVELDMPTDILGEPGRSVQQGNLVRPLQPRRICLEKIEANTAHPTALEVIDQRGRDTVGQEHYGTTALPHCFHEIQQTRVVRTVEARLHENHSLDLQGLRDCCVVLGRRGRERVFRACSPRIHRGRPEYVHMRVASQPRHWELRAREILDRE